MDTRGTENLNSENKSIFYEGERSRKGINRIILEVCDKSHKILLFSWEFVRS